MGRTEAASGPDADRTREKILRAAAETFAETGYYGATVRRICARAGTNIALVNYYFGDKMGLYTEVLRQSIRAGHVEAIGRALDHRGSPEETLRAIVKARMHGMGTGDMADRQFRIVIHELAHPTPALARVIEDVLRPVYGRVLELIGGMIGLPPADEKTRFCAQSVMGQIMVYALARPVLRRLWPELKMSPDQLDRIADHIADFSFAYLRELGSRKQASGKRGGSGK